MTTTTCIAYWLDATSDSADPRWIVSAESGGGSSTIRVLAADATEADARRLAVKKGRERGLPVERH